MSEQKQESKRERFIRLAEARTNKILDMLMLLGNCSNTSAYEYSQKDVDQIFAALEAGMRDAKKQFSRTESIKNTKFALK